jgi:hypothetical protein
MFNVKIYGYVKKEKKKKKKKKNIEKKQNESQKGQFTPNFSFKEHMLTKYNCLKKIEKAGQSFDY